ncbi:MAG: lytic murein transglycosylase B [Burkholderiales bacterium]|nr:lytic murein transglycosylase B [Burkholderiales bacterium]
MIIFSVHPSSERAKRWLVWASVAAITGCTAPHALPPSLPAPSEPAASAPLTPPDEAKSVGDPHLILSTSLTPKPSPRNGDDYAQRADARQLASDIALNQALPSDWVWAQMAQARYREAVSKLIMPAASSTAKNWSAYRRRFIEPIRIRAGQAFWKTYAKPLQRAERVYGVPASVIAGVLGVETIYGRQTGGFKVIDVLTTLSLDFPDGRSDRSAFFRRELGEFLKLCAEQKWNPQSIQGSYAGAIGWPQFMPSSIRRYAVDFDEDGRIDLQNSPVDAIGSVAKYLADHGWQSSLPSYYSVTAPSDLASLNKLLEPDIVPSFTADEMKSLGAQLPPEALEHPGKLALVQLLNGNGAPTLIAGTQNFYVVTRYNQSSYYALAVIQLGQAVSAP